MRPTRAGVVVGMHPSAIVAAVLLTARADARPPDVGPWLEAACESGQERSVRTHVVLPATTRAPTPDQRPSVSIHWGGALTNVDGVPLTGDLASRVGVRLGATSGRSGPVALFVDRTTPSAELAELLVALEPAGRPVAIAVRSLGGTELPPVPDPAVAVERAVQVDAIWKSGISDAARVQAMHLLGPRLAVPSGTCPELDVALRSPASSLGDCATAATEVIAVLGRCDLDDAATLRAATIVGLQWAPPERPPLVLVSVTTGAGVPLEGTWEDVVHRVLAADEPAIRLP